MNRKRTPHREIILAQVWPMIAEERKAKQEATQFKPGVCPNPEGRKGKEQVDTESCPPVSRDIKAKHEQSAVGQIAKRAKVSHHKAAQVVAVAKAVEAGVMRNDLLHEAVMMQAELKTPGCYPERLILAAPKLQEQPNYRSCDLRCQQFYRKN